MSVHPLDHAICLRERHPGVERKAHEPCARLVGDAHAALRACVTQTGGRGMQRHIVEYRRDPVRPEPSYQSIACGLIRQQEIVEMTIVLAVSGHARQARFAARTERREPLMVAIPDYAAILRECLELLELCE